MAKPITAAEATELKQLWAELPKAYQRAAEALRTDGKPLEGAALARFMILDAKAGDMVRRISQLQGD
jgi:hypothetical protein